MNEQWIVTMFFDYEPCEVYGTFASEEEALAWADRAYESKCAEAGAWVVNRIRGTEE